MEVLHYLFYVYIYIVSLQYSIVIVKDKTGGLKYCHNLILLCVTWKKLYVITYLRTARTQKYLTIMSITE